MAGESNAPRRRARLLNERETAFCRSFVVSGNAADAARKAGYSKAFANRAGYALLKRSPIMEEIERLKDANRLAVQVSLIPSLSGESVVMPELRRQVDAEIAAQLDRVYCIAGLYQNAEVALGRRKVTISITRKRTEPGKGEVAVRTTEVEVYRPDAAAANQALEKLAKLLPDSINTSKTDGDVLAPEVAAVIDGFRGVVNRYRERTEQAQNARNSAVDINATQNESQLSTDPSQLPSNQLNDQPNTNQRNSLNAGNNSEDAENGGSPTNLGGAGRGTRQSKPDDELPEEWGK